MEIHIPGNRDLLQLTDPTEYVQAQPYSLYDNPHYETFPEITKPVQRSTVQYLLGS
jgi:hypothetical protein